MYNFRYTSMRTYYKINYKRISRRFLQSLTVKKRLNTLIKQKKFY